MSLEEIKCFDRSMNEWEVRHVISNHSIKPIFFHTGGSNVNSTRSIIRTIYEKITFIYYCIFTNCADVRDTTLLYLHQYLHTRNITAFKSEGRGCLELRFHKRYYDSNTSNKN